MMITPIGGEAGPLKASDPLILGSRAFPIVDQPSDGTSKVAVQLILRMYLLEFGTAIAFKFSTMTTQLRSTVVGVFEDRLHANQAINELHQAGFTGSDIGVTMKHVEGVDDIGVPKEGSHAESGALAGALTGLGLGALAGLGVLAGVIPVVGPAIAAGTLGVMLSNAAAGAGVAGLVGALVGAGIPEDEATYYQGEFEAGRAIVTVNAGSRVEDATAILRGCGAYDMNSRAT